MLWCVLHPLAHTDSCCVIGSWMLVGWCVAVATNGNASVVTSCCLLVCVSCFVECARCCCGKNDYCKGAGATQCEADERTQVMMESVVCSETLEGNGVADAMEGGAATRVLVWSCIEHT